MLREHFAVQSRQGMEKVDCTEQAGHGKGHFLGKSTSIFYLKGPALAKYTREQRWALVPVDLCVLTCFPVQHFLRSPVLPRFCFAFLYTRSVCVGVGEQLITRALCVYGRIRRAGSTRHLAITPPRHTCAVYENTGGKPVLGQTHISSSTIPPFHLSSQYTS